MEKRLRKSDIAIMFFGLERDGRRSAQYVSESEGERENFIHQKFTGKNVHTLPTPPSLLSSYDFHARRKREKYKWEKSFWIRVGANYTMCSRVGQVGREMREKNFPLLSCLSHSLSHPHPLRCRSTMLQGHFFGLLLNCIKNSRRKNLMRSLGWIPIVIVAT